MRRSNSTSNIPLPSSRRDSKPRERALSVARYSRGRSIDAATPLLSHNRLKPPGGPKFSFSAQKTNLCTPSGATPTGGYKRSYSSIGSSSSISATKSPAAERKLFQKLLSDKKWLAERHSQIQDFILTSGLFDASLAGDLRPPTIANFIDLITKLFDLILKQVVKIRPINTTNYGDIVITNLKLLKYPGQITNSVVKAINTMHGWPQFIAIISFLVDKANLSTMEMEFKAQLDNEYKNDSDLQDCAWKFWSTVGLAFSGGEMPEIDMTEPNLVELKSKVKTLVGADTEAVQILEEREATQRLELERIQAKVKENRQLSEEMKAKFLERQKVIDQYEANKGNREKEVKKEIKELKEKLINHKEKINELLLSTKSLNNVISTQTCTVEQKGEMLNKIASLKRLTERRKVNAAKLSEQRDEMDIKLGNSVIEIEHKVDEWNVAIQQTLLPELKDLKLREKGFLKPEYLDEILEVRKVKINLERQLLNEYKENELQIKKLQNLKESMAIKNQTLSSARKEVDNLRQTVKNLEEKKLAMVSDFNLFSIEHDSRVKKSLAMRDEEIKEQKLLIDTLTNEIEREIEKMEKLKKSGTDAITRSHNAAIKDFQETHNIRHRMLADVSDAHQMTAYQCGELFAHLRKMQEVTAKLYGPQEDKENIE